MTINTTTFRADYAGNGVTTAFPVPFIFFGLDELQVIERDQATGTETTLVRGTHYTVAGGGGAIGTVTATPAPAAGKQWTILRSTATVQQFDFTRNDPFPSDSVERALDRATAIVQEALGLNERTLRVPTTDPEAGLVLPANVVRANKLLSFDATGKPIALSPSDMSATTVTPTGSTAARQLAEHLKRADPRNWGGIGNGVQDDTAALAAAATFAGAQGLVWFVPEGTWRHTAQLVIPTAAAGIEMAGSLLYDGAGNEAALVIGDGGSVNTQAKRFLGLRVVRASLSSWTDEDDIGIQLRNIDACLVEVRRVEGFTIGVQLLGVDRGCEDSDLFYGRIVNNRYGLDLRTGSAAAWMNSLRHYGGHFANDSGTYPLLSRFGVRFSKAGGAYDLHNAHLFLGPSFELQDGGAGVARPFLLEVSGRGLRATGIRMEASSAFVARHMTGFEDALYEISYTGTHAFNVAVEYDAAATRAGGTAVSLHQASAAQFAPKLIAEAGDVRRRAFREDATQTGFEGMALLSSNPVGPPTTMNTLLFPGLSGLTLNADTVTIPTSRALGFVVDTTICKEFLVAADGAELRVVVQQYDASENVLAPATNIVRASNSALVEGGATAQWWEASSNLDALTGGLMLHRLQRITVPAACKKAFIGVRGGSASAAIRALRLYVAGEHFPQVITRERAAGVNGWGLRRMRGSVGAWLVPDLTTGAVAHLTAVTGDQPQVYGAVQGDRVQVGYTMSAGSQNGGVIFSGSVSVAGRVSVSVHNQSAGTIQLDGGAAATVDLLIEVTKPWV